MTIASAMNLSVRAAAMCGGPVCGRARRGAGDRQRSKSRLISIMAGPLRDVVALSARLLAQRLSVRQSVAGNCGPSRRAAWDAQPEIEDGS
jgi:hypothetical protein